MLHAKGIQSSPPGRVENEREIFHPFPKKKEMEGQIRKRKRHLEEKKRKRKNH
jgi:hypothetical protein